MPDLPFEPVSDSKRQSQCVRDGRVRGCGRWFETPFVCRGRVIVPAMWCPDCFEEKLDAGHERATGIWEGAEECPS
jgi:hypothetical protein